MNENLKMINGDSFVFELLIEDLSTDLTGAYFSCKKDKTADTYIFQKSLGNGIAKVSETTSSKTYKVTLSPNDTKNMEEDDYYYDIQIEVGNDVMTPFIGILKVVKGVTEN